MAVEQNLQATMIKFLKAKGCYVVKTQAAPGIPVGCPDILALFPGGGWAALEVKASNSSKFQPLQKETIKKLDGMYYARAVYPENWLEIKSELEKMI